MKTLLPALLISLLSIKYSHSQLANVIILYKCDGDITVFPDKKITTFRIVSASGIFDSAAVAMNLNGGLDGKASTELFKFDMKGFDTTHLGRVARKCLPCSTLKSDIDTNINNLLGSTLGGGGFNSFKIRCEAETCGSQASCAPTGLKPSFINKKQLAKILGNPTSEQSLLQLNSKAFIQVYNMMGQVLREEALAAGIHKLNFYGWPKGRYLLRAVSVTKTESHSIIVQ